MSKTIVAFGLAVAAGAAAICHETFAAVFLGLFALIVAGS